MIWGLRRSKMLRKQNIWLASYHHWCVIFFYIASFEIPHTRTICKKWLLITITSVWGHRNHNWRLQQYHVPSPPELCRASQCSVSSVIRLVASSWNMNLMRINEKSNKILCGINYQDSTKLVSWLSEPWDASVPDFFITTKIL